jgi:AraC family transcriptional activator of pobA
MNKNENNPYKFESLTEFHKVLGLKKPLHPLVSLIDIEDIKYTADEFLHSKFL